MKRYGYIFALAICLLLADCSQKSSGLKYSVLLNDTLQAVVLLQDANKPVTDTTSLNVIADSLYNAMPSRNPLSTDNYTVWFYYREDWKGKMYYAGKLWSYDYASQKLIPQKLDMTGVISADN